jgi:hypothetical protein
VATAPTAEPAPASTVLRRRWLLPLAALVALVAVAVGLLVWAPWAGDDDGSSPELEARSLEVVPYTAELPPEWSAYPADDGTVTFGPGDLSDVALDDEAAVAEAAGIAADDPERLVAVFVAPETGLGDESPADLPGQVEARLPAGSEISAGAMTSVGGQDALRLTGTVPLGDDTALRVVGISVGSDVLLLCAAPEAVFDEWSDTFDDVVDSLAPA